MRFWTLVFTVLAVVMLAFVPITANSAQAQQISTKSMIMASSANVQPVGVAVQAIVSDCRDGICSLTAKGYATIKQGVIVTKVKVKAVRKRGFSPSCLRSGPQRE